MNGENSTISYTEEKNPRFLSIDIFKGIAIVLTIFINSIAYFSNTPSWNKGTEFYGLTYVDLVAPFFIFMIALTFKASFNRRVKKIGYIKTYIHFIKRNSLLILIGFLITIQISSTGISFSWGTLQMLGTISFIYLLFIRSNQFIRLLISTSGLIFHQILLNTGNKVIIYDAPHGGIIGLIPLGCLLLISSIITENFHDRSKNYKILIESIICIILGIFSSLIWGISRNYITIPFVLISVGISSLIYFLLYNIFEIRSEINTCLKNEKLFSVMGRYTLLLYILQAIFKYIPYIFLPIDTNFLIIITFGIIMVLFNYFLAFFLNKNDIILVL